MGVSEQWAPVPGHPGYEISDQGRVRSYRSRQGHPIDAPRLMSPGIGKGGYLQVKLGRSFQCAVHLLVLRAFVGEPPDGTECRHLDGDRTNARLSNLRWGTKAENYHDRRGHGTANDGERHGNAKLTNEQAQMIRASTRPAKEVAAELGVSVGTVHQIRSGWSWRGVGDAPVYVPGRRVGSRNGNARLTEDQVREIRASAAPRRDLAARYGISRSMIGAIQTGKNWRHVA